MNRLGALVSLGLVLLAIGCGPEAPSVRYSGSTLAAHKPTDVKVYRATNPDRPFDELGTVEVTCPTAAQAKFAGQVDIEGGCSFETALQMAVEEAARAGADAIFSLRTSAGGNGSLVSLTAVAVRYTGQPAVVAPPKKEKSTPEERLKRLKQMADDGVITPEDYEKRKSEILKEL